MAGLRVRSVLLLVAVRVRVLLRARFGLFHSRKPARACLCAASAVPGCCLPLCVSARTLQDVKPFQYLSRCDFLAGHVSVAMSDDAIPFVLQPEEQHTLYLAIRDGDLSTVMELLRTGGQTDDIRQVVNCRPFEALWHAPGPEATCLHLAACCLQVEVVRFLLENGADPEVVANGCKAIDIVDTIDLMAAAREQRPDDVVEVKKLLRTRG